MPIITKIKPQKNKKRVNIYLDGKFAFGLDLENIMKLGLKEDQELTKTEVKKIVEEAEFKKVYDKILKFATLRPRSEKEFKDWLRKHGVHKSLHKKLFNKLKRLDLLDDRKFTAWWIEQRKEFKPRGKKALYSELMKKGVDKKIIDEAISDAKIDETKMAKELIEKKKYKWKKLVGFEKRKKMSSYLARKGFSWGIIREVVNEELD